MNSKTEQTDLVKVLDQIPKNSGTALKSALFTGDLLLKTYFNNDIQQYKSKNSTPGKKQFLALCRSDNLRKLGHSERSLRNFIQVAATDQDYPEDIRSQVPLSIRIALLCVPRKKRIELAEKAVAGNLSTREVLNQVRLHRQLEGNAVVRDANKLPVISPDPDITLAEMSNFRKQLFESAKGLSKIDMQIFFEKCMMESNQILNENAPQSAYKPVKQRYAVIPPYVPHYGSKTLVATELIKNIKEISQLILKEVEFREPYCGSAAVAFNLIMKGLVKKVWLNDIDENVVGLFINLKDHPKELKDRIEAHRNMSEDDCLNILGDFENGNLAGVDKTFAYIVRQTVTYRGSSSVKFPYRLNKWHPDVFLNKVDIYNLLLNRVEVKITCQDGLDVIKAPGDCFLFLDPPYIRKGGNKYPYAFKLQDHLNLAKVLNEIEQPWLMTYDDDSFVRTLYKGKKITPVIYHCRMGAEGAIRESWISNDRELK